MNNEPVAWMDEETECFVYSQYDYEDLDEHGKDGLIPLYTQDQLEEARKLGMQQERALWELSASTQEIEVTMSEKGYKVGNLEDIPDRHLTWEDAPFQVPVPKELADEIDKALGIKR